MRRLYRIYPAVTAIAALCILVTGMRSGSGVAGDGDAYGYVSEADAIAHGSLRIDQRFVRTMTWPFADWAFAPNGYRPATVRGFIVPIYPAGLPLVMALVQRTAGANAVFYVIPVLGAAAVWLTGILGTRVRDPVAGTVAAALLALSPVFLHQLMLPLSDVPATAWWTASLVLALGAGRRSAFGCGAAASIAVLTRPNLVLLAGVVGLFLVANVAIADRRGRSEAVERVVWYVAGVVPGCVAVAAINQYLYGSPFRSGYEEFDALFAWANVGANLDRYPRWLIWSETPLVCLMLASPWVLRQASADVGGDRKRSATVALLIAFVFLVGFSYLFYIPFGRDDWTYVRFLLPAFPPMLVLSVAVALDVLRRAFARDGVRIAVAVVLFATVGGWLAHVTAISGAFSLQRVERRYKDVGRYIAAVYPANAMFIASLHAGSIRYYSGRLTLRYDWLLRERLDSAVAVLRGQGYQPYIVVEEGEEPGFRDRFGAKNEFGRLDWPAAAERSEPIRVRIYDPADRSRSLAGVQIVTHEIAPALPRR